MNTTAYRIELNGVPARADDLRALVQTNYGHFTAMQVRERRVRGLDLHLQRLAQATRELFGSELDLDHVRACLRHAIGADMRPLSLRVNVFSRALDRRCMNRPAAPDVVVIAAAASVPVVAPLRLKSFVYQRELPAIKHVGTFALFHYRRLAQQAGFDDALFVDDDSRISEGSVWNVGFFDGNGVIWPYAPQLHGISMQLLQAGLMRRGVPSVQQPVRLADLARFRAAFFTNSSSPVQPIARIDDIEFSLDDVLMDKLVEAYESNPLEPV
jgi:branched-subunit amino acid aminotransferase/4-amino-4-deoxychorismate lyase